MEMLQRTHQALTTGPTPPSDADAGVADALAACRRLADAADAAIDQAYSGDAETFLAASQQAGGQ